MQHGLALAWKTAPMSPGPHSVSPLHIMLTLMNRHWAAGNEAEAVALAKLAAPFVHPRAPAARPPIDLSEASDEQLDGEHEGLDTE